LAQQQRPGTSDHSTLKLAARETNLLQQAGILPEMKLPPPVLGLPLEASEASGGGGWQSAESFKLSNWKRKSSESGESGRYTSLSYDYQKWFADATVREGWKA